MQKVCSLKTLLCLTLSTYLVLQQLSLFQTARPYFTKCINLPTHQNRSIQ